MLGGILSYWIKHLSLFRNSGNFTGRVRRKFKLSTCQRITDEQKLWRVPFLCSPLTPPITEGFIFPLYVPYGRAGTHLFFQRRFCSSTAKETCAQPHGECRVAGELQLLFEHMSWPLSPQGEITQHWQRAVHTEIGSQYKDRDVQISKSRFSWIPQCTWCSLWKEHGLRSQENWIYNLALVVTSLNFGFFFCKMRVNYLPSCIVFRTRGNDERKAPTPSRYSAKVTFSPCLYLK